MSYHRQEVVGVVDFTVLHEGRAPQHTSGTNFGRVGAPAAGALL